MKDFLGGVFVTEDSPKLHWGDIIFNETHQFPQRVTSQDIPNATVNIRRDWLAYCIYWVRKVSGLRVYLTWSN